MNNICIKSGALPLLGNIILPASKSESNRVLIINALSIEKFKIHNLSQAEDTQVLKKILKRIDNGHLNKNFNCRDAGTVARFLLSYLSLTKKMDCIISGSERLCKRPMHDLVNCLNELGAKIEYTGEYGFLPVKISAPETLKATVSVKCNTSSQFASSLLLVAPALSLGLNIKLESQIVSAPYIDLTLGLMRKFGINYQRRKNKIVVKHQTYNPISHEVEADWSAAAFWYQMAALSKDFKIRLEGLKKNSLQGDSILAKLFGHFGVKTTFDDKGLVLSKTKLKMQAFCFDFSNYPDIFPSIALTAALLKVPAHFTGLQNLAHKESDRLQAVTNEAKKFNLIFDMYPNNSGVYIKPQTPSYKNSIINTYNDHRIAMAFAACAPVIENIKISNPAVVGKSYPNFWEDMRNCGFVF